MSDHLLPPLMVEDLRIEPTLARRIRMVCLDVDGVLTDGGIYLGAAEDGDQRVPFELKRYDIQDGLGVHLMREAGLHVIIITGRVSHSVAMRGDELRVSRVVQDKHARKLPALRELLVEFDCTMEEVAFIGDDLPDLGPMREVALPVAVGNAVPEVQRISRVQLRSAGGHGAVREFTELLLKARGEWMDTVERYVVSRDVPAEAMS